MNPNCLTSTLLMSSSWALHSLFAHAHLALKTTSNAFDRQAAHHAPLSKLPTAATAAHQACNSHVCSTTAIEWCIAASVAAEHLDSLYGAVSSRYTIGTSPDTLYGLCSCLYTSKHSPGRRVYHKTCLAVPSCWYVPWYACGIPQSPIRHTKPPFEFVVAILMH